MFSGGTQYSINGTSGSITVASALTYSVTPVELVVTATDGGTPQKSASVTVTVSTVTRMFLLMFTTTVSFCHCYCFYRHTYVFVDVYHNSQLLSLLLFLP